MGTRRRLGRLLAGLGAVALTGYGISAWPAWTRELVGPPARDLPAELEGGREPIDGAFVGHTESRIVEQFGPPTHSWAGHYGAPSMSEQRKYPDATTATYVRPSGVQYLSYCIQGGRRVCFTSHWMPNGCAF